MTFDLCFFCLFEIYSMSVESCRIVRSVSPSDDRRSLNEFELILCEKRQCLEEQRREIQRTIDERFEEIFQEIIEIRRSCRNEIDRQMIDFQIELQQMFDAIQYKKLEILLQSDETIRFDQFENRLSKLEFSPRNDLEVLSNFLKKTISIVEKENFNEFSTKNKIEQPICSTTSNLNDLNQFKYSSTIRLTFPADMIASNSRSILSYYLEKSFLNYSTINGANLSSMKLYRLLAPVSSHNIRLWDLIWCSYSQFYVMFVHFSIRTKSSIFSQCSENDLRDRSEQEKKSQCCSMLKLK